MTPVIMNITVSGLSNTRWHISTKLRKSISQATLQVSFINKLNTVLDVSSFVSVVGVCLHYCSVLMSAVTVSLNTDALSSVCAI